MEGLEGACCFLLCFLLDSVADDPACWSKGLLLTLLFARALEGHVETNWAPTAE